MGLLGGFSGLNSGLTGPKQIDFLSNGTWNCPAGLTCIDVFIIGAGGGGGGGAGTCSTTACINLVGGAGGGGGGVSFCSLAAGVLCSSYCVIVGAGGAGGSKATTCNANGFNGVTGGCSAFGPIISSGGGAGAKGVCIISTACIVTNGGAGGSGTTFVGSTGGCGRQFYNCPSVAPTDSSGGNGGNGGGAGGGCTFGGGGYSQGASNSQATRYICGLRLGCGQSGIDFTPPGPLAAQVYGSGGGGGKSAYCGGASLPESGCAGSQGIVRVVEYY
jgi:hypothetical protein